MTAAIDDPAAQFLPERPRLLRLAYRMLGSVAEAEDVVQEAYLRWHQADRSTVRVPGAFLVRTVTRLALDALRRARTRRAAYTGPWLPEPWIAGPEEQAGVDGLTLPLMLTLERLSPLERAAFLQHDVFERDFDEIGRTLGRAPEACRQLARRARRHLADARPRFAVEPGAGERLAGAFFKASREGDVTALRALLAADAVTVSDGGGKVLAALNPILGRERALRFFAGLARKSGYRQPPVLHLGLIDGLPGYVTLERGEVLQVTALAVADGLIEQVLIQRNPDKLRHLEVLRAGQVLAA